jgi:hypothetical protein
VPSQQAAGTPISNVIELSRLAPPNTIRNDNVVPRFVSGWRRSARSRWEASLKIEKTAGLSGCYC